MAGPGQRARLGLPPVPTSSSLPRELADEVEEVVHGLRADRAVLVHYWHSLRQRDPIVEALTVTWARRSGPELLTLEPRQIEALSAFHDRLSALRLWAQHTEVMSATLEARLDRALEQLTPLAEHALALLDGRTPRWHEPEEDVWRDGRDAP